MPKLSKQIIVAAPADAVWQVIGPGFDRIGDWATAIPASTAIPAPSATRVTPRVARAAVPGLGDASVAGRVCTTGTRLVPRVTETLVAYDDANRTLTSDAPGIPDFVTVASKPSS